MIPLLPYEKYLASQIGVTEEQYQEFKAIMLKRSIERPAAYPRAGFVAPFIVPFLVNLAIGIGVSLLASLLFPQQQRGGRVSAKQEGGKNLTSNQRLSPRYGFNAIQEPATVGQLTPVVIAKRENGYGGVRIAMPLIWSQLLSLRGGQMFRGIFLAGTANMAENAWDMRGWAFGNNTLGAYAFFGPGDTEGGRFTIYYNRGGGRITSDSQIAGRQADKDVGNSENDGGPDVYALRLRSDIYETAFCMSEAPSTSTVFGLYGWCPNAMLYRPTVRIGPTVRARIGESGNVRVEDDAAALVEIWKGKWHWSMRAGLTQWKAVGAPDYVNPATGPWEIKGETVNPGDRLRYKLSKSTDARTEIKFDVTNADIREDNKSRSKQDMTEVGASVAGTQSVADSALIPGELYKIGTAWAVLENRLSVTDPDSTIFVSDQDEEPPGNGNTMEYIFIVVKTGRVQFIGPNFLDPPETGTTILPPQYDPDNNLANLPSGTEGRYRVCSAAAQIFRMSLASVAAVREVRVMEIGFRSRVGISVNGMTEFRGCEPLQEINARAGQNQKDEDSGGRLSVSIFTSGTITTKVKRYSTFRMVYRNNADDWIEFPEVFAIASSSGEDVYNYMRIDFPTPARWEVRFEPVASWEVRRELLDTILVLDSTGKKEKKTGAGGVEVVTTGYRDNPTNGKVRRIQQLDPAEDIGLGWSDYDDTSTIGDPGSEAYQSMVDGYGHFAEGFCYDNIQSTVGNAPEHEIVYVNYPSELNKTPSYECLAIVGVNIVASLEFSNLQQFSGYCINGYEMRQLLDNDAIGSSHLFPDWLRELMTSFEVGPSPPLPDIQINRDSFEAAAQWCQDRNYFYDAAESEPLNILDWASETAQAHLLKLVRIGGVYYLKKAIEFDDPLPIAGLFTNGNIVEESFRLETVDYQTRQPFVVEVKWREENLDIENPLFPRERVATVAEDGTCSNAPVESLDLSKWCTNYQQAIDAACYLIRFRRLADHRISFQTTPDIIGAQLASGSIIKVAIDVTNYDRAVQGFITSTGRIVSTRPDLVPTANGSYPALLWDGVNEAIDGNITIASGVASPAGRFFAIAAPETLVRTYEISKLSFSADGIITVEAFHHPVDEAGMSLLGVNWTTYETDANWTISL